MIKRKLLLGVSTLLFVCSIGLTIDISEANVNEDEGKDLPTQKKCYNSKGEYTGNTTECGEGGNGCNVSDPC